MENKLSVKIKAVLDEARAVLKESTPGSLVSRNFSNVVGKLEEAYSVVSRFEEYQEEQRKKAAASGSVEVPVAE